MKEIQLTQGQVALVDDQDYEFLSQWKWYAQKDRYTYYAVRRDGKKRMKMHRQVLGLGYDSNLVGDHRDHNGLNNQRSNLRVATKSQNAANRLSRKNSTSKYLGVSIDRLGKSWQVHVVKGKAQKYVGLFDNEESAALAYNKAAAEIHGEFASLNKITA